MLEAWLQGASRPATATGRQNRQLVQLTTNAYLGTPFKPVRRNFSVRTSHQIDGPYLQQQRSSRPGV